jgi:hypothetical protein
VTANGGMKEQTSYTAMGMRGFGGGMGSITPEQNVIGTLIVDLYDSKGQALVWRGIAQNTLNNNGGKNQQSVQKAVTKMFKQWPKSSPNFCPQGRIWASLNSISQCTGSMPFRRSRMRCSQEPNHR